MLLVCGINVIFLDIKLLSASPIKREERIFMKNTLKTHLTFLACFAAIFCAMFTTTITAHAANYYCDQDDDEFELELDGTYQLTYADASSIASMSYTSYNTDVVTVSSTGLVTAVGYGYTWVCAVATDTYGYTYDSYI